LPGVPIDKPVMEGRLKQIAWPQLKKGIYGGEDMSATRILSQAQILSPELPG